MPSRNPERANEHSESQSQGPRELIFNNEQINSISQGGIILKRGLELKVDNEVNRNNLSSQLTRYAFSLMGKYVQDTDCIRITKDVTLDLESPLNTPGLSITGNVVIPQGSSARIKRRRVTENSNGTSTITETIDANTGSETSEQQLTAEELRLRTEQEQITQQRIQETHEQSRGDRKDLAHSIMSDISEIFSSDQNFLQKLSAVISLILDRLMGGSDSQSDASSNSSSEVSGQESQETQEQAAEAVREEFNLNQHQQNPVFDLRLNPFSEEKADLSSYLTFKAEGEAARKRLIIRPESSTMSVPSGFETKSLENYESELQSADADTFTNNLNQPMAIESKTTNPGFVSLVSVMQNFLNTPESNSSKRAEIANNIRSQFIQEGNPNSAIAGRFLETFITSG